MTYNKETRELTITLPEGDWYPRKDLIMALDEIESMSKEDRSEFFIYVKTSDTKAVRAQYTSTGMALFLAYILKLDVDSRFQKSPLQLLQDPQYQKSFKKVIGGIAQELQDEETKRDLYGDNYDPDDDDL